MQSPLLDGLSFIFAIQCLQEFTERTPHLVPQLKYEMLQVFNKYGVFTPDDLGYMPNVATIDSYDDYQSAEEDESFAKGRFIIPAVVPVSQGFFSLSDIDFDELQRILDRAHGKIY